MVLNRHAATREHKYDASPISLQIANLCAAIWSLKDIGIIPGASSKSSSPPTRIQRRTLVTPGRGALSATRRPRILFMRADFPTLGNPITTPRTGRGRNPRLFLLSLRALLHSNAANVASVVPSPRFALVHKAVYP